MKQKLSADRLILAKRWRKSVVAGIVLLGIYSAPCFSTELSTVSISHGNYLVKAQIIMPHLESNLRYANTQSSQCLGRQDASNLFPILDHVSFTGCALVGTQPNVENQTFDLVCANPEAATGSVRFIIDQDVFRATLNIKMGGKNMKFSQRVFGRRVGDC